MAENLLSKFNLDGTEMIIADTKARTDANNATNTNASKAMTTANVAKTTALKKALVTHNSTTQTMTITQGGE